MGLRFLSEWAQNIADPGRKDYQRNLELMKLKNFYEQQNEMARQSFLNKQLQEQLAAREKEAMLGVASNPDLPPTVRQTGWGRAGMPPVVSPGPITAGAGKFAPMAAGPVQNPWTEQTPQQKYMAGLLENMKSQAALNADQLAAQREQWGESNRLAQERLGLSREELEATKQAQSLKTLLAAVPYFTGEQKYDPYSGQWVASAPIFNLGLKQKYNLGQDIASQTFPGYQPQPYSNTEETNALVSAAQTPEGLAKLEAALASQSEVDRWYNEGIDVDQIRAAVKMAKAAREREANKPGFWQRVFGQVGRNAAMGQIP